jgi:hypothetical protein
LWLNSTHASLCTTSKLQFSLFTNIPNYFGSLVGTRDEQDVARMASHVRVIGANNCRTKFAAQNERSQLACVVRERSHVSSLALLLTYFPSERQSLCGFVIQFRSLNQPTQVLFAKAKCRQRGGSQRICSRVCFVSQRRDCFPTG